MPKSLTKSALNSIASTTASSMISMRSSRPLASKPHDNPGEREQNPHYRHYKGLTIGAFASDCSSGRMRSGSAGDAVRQRRECDQGSRAAAFRSAVPHMGSATASAVRLVGLGCPSPEPAAGRSGRMRDHCRAPDRSAPSPTERPPQSAAPATPPSDAGSPRTTAAVAIRGR